MLAQSRAAPQHPARPVDLLDSRDLRHRRLAASTSSTSCSARRKRFRVGDAAPGMTWPAPG